MTELMRVERGFALLDGAAELGRTGLVLSRELTFDEWTDLGIGLQKLESGMQWALGDWLNYGEQKYGEKYAQAVEETGYTYQSLADIAHVAQRVTISRRRENLRFSHHREVAALEPDEQEKLLEAADKGRWSVQALRDAVRNFRQQIGAGPKPVRELPVKVTVSEHEPDPVDGLTKELEASQRQVDQLTAEVEALTSDDTAKEIRKLSAEIAGLNARVASLLNEKKAAVDQAQYGEKKLKEIRKALGVERDRDIMDAIMALRKQAA